MLFGRYNASDGPIRLLDVPHCHKFLYTWIVLYFGAIKTFFIWFDLKEEKKSPLKRPTTEKKVVNIDSGNGLVPH